MSSLLEMAEAMAKELDTVGQSLVGRGVRWDFVMHPFDPTPEWWREGAHLYGLPVALRTDGCRAKGDPALVLVTA